MAHVGRAKSRGAGALGGRAGLLPISIYREIRSKSQPIRDGGPEGSFAVGTVVGASATSSGPRLRLGQIVSAPALSSQCAPLGGAATRAPAEDRSPFWLCRVEHGLPPGSPSAGHCAIPVTWLELAASNATTASESVRLAADGTAEVGYCLGTPDVAGINAAAILCVVRGPAELPVSAGGYFGLREAEADRIATMLMNELDPPPAAPTMAEAEVGWRRLTDQSPPMYLSAPISPVSPASPPRGSGDELSPEPPVATLLPSSATSTEVVQEASTAAAAGPSPATAVAAAVVEDITAALTEVIEPFAPTTTAPAAAATMAVGTAAASAGASAGGHGMLLPEESSSCPSASEPPTVCRSPMRRLVLEHGAVPEQLQPMELAQAEEQRLPASSAAVQGKRDPALEPSLWPGRVPVSSRRRPLATQPPPQPTHVPTQVPSASPRQGTQVAHHTAAAAELGVREVSLPSPKRRRPETHTVAADGQSLPAVAVAKAAMAKAAMAKAAAAKARAAAAAAKARAAAAKAAKAAAAVRSPAESPLRQSAQDLADESPPVYLTAAAAPAWAQKLSPSVPKWAGRAAPLPAKRRGRPAKPRQALKAAGGPKEEGFLQRTAKHPRAAPALDGDR